MVDLVPLEDYRGADRRELFEDLTRLPALLVPLADLPVRRFVTGTWVWPGVDRGPARGVALRLAVGLPDVGPVRQAVTEAFDPAGPGPAEQEPPEDGVLGSGRLDSGALWMTLLARLSPGPEPVAVQLLGWRHDTSTAVGAVLVLLAPGIDPGPHQEELLAAAGRLQDTSLPRSARISLVAGLAVLRRAVGGDGLAAAADEERMRWRVLTALAQQLPADAEQRALGLVRLRTGPDPGWWHQRHPSPPTPLTVMPGPPAEVARQPLPEPRPLAEQWPELRPEPPRLTRRQLAGSLASRVLGGAVAGLAGIASMMAVVAAGLPSWSALRVWGTVCLVLGAVLTVAGVVASALLEGRRRRPHRAVTALAGCAAFLLVVAAGTPFALATL